MIPMHSQWAARVLSMRVNQSKKGPDLLAEDKNVEIKNGLKPKNWTLFADQLEYGLNGKPCYLFLVLYENLMPIEKIRKTYNVLNLESLVIKRTGFMVNWDWVLDLPVPNNPIYRYPRLNLPPTIAKREVYKGQINFTEGTNPKDFGL